MAAKQIILTNDNATQYKSREDNPVIKYAFLVPERVTFYKDVFWKEGSVQDMEPPFMLVVMPDSKNPGRFDSYGAEIKRFKDEHNEVGPNMYVSCKKVLAVELTEETEILTWVEGRLEATQIAPAGHFLVQQPNGEQQGISPDQFHSLYVKA